MLVLAMMMERQEGSRRSILLLLLLLLRGGEGVVAVVERSRHVLLLKEQEEQDDDDDDIYSCESHLASSTKKKPTSQAPTSRRMDGVVLFYPIKRCRSRRANVAMFVAHVCFCMVARKIRAFSIEQHNFVQVYVIFSDISMRKT